MDKVYVKLVVIFLFIGFLFIPDAKSAIVNAGSCSQTDVNSAIASAATGDTVFVPAGSCTWTAGITIPNSKKITIQGAGRTSTIITASTVGKTLFTLGFSGARITAIGFVDAMIFTEGNGFRIDHCDFTASTSAGVAAIYSAIVTAYTIPYGLIDSNLFVNAVVKAPGTKAMLTDSNAQHRLWAEPIGLGDVNAVYIEGNTFNANIFANAIDSNYGGRYVFRFNTINNSGTSGNKGLYIEAHSAQGGQRGTQRWEIYNNILNNTGESIYEPFRLRGGTGVVFNNSIQGTWTNYEIGLDNVRSIRYGDPPNGYCDGTAINGWDQNSGIDPGSGYPCRDQIGYGYDAVLWAVGNPWNQVKMPVYAWNNKQSDGKTELPFAVIQVNIGTPIFANRDFYNYTASFNGNSGMGMGTLANLPSTCTTGVAYWATDQGDWNKSGSGGQGVLYKCISTNNWELYYTPYPYPHPLSGGAAPQKPNNLQVVNMP